MRIPLRQLAVGTMFADRYQVISELGGGGMGKVYKVLDKEINEVVALKILKPEIAEDEKIIDRFRNELKLARRISHKNVCGMYHLSKDEHDTPYITMEYVPGEDLKSLIRRIGPLSVGKAVFVGKQICEGLAEAHRLGIVHRDLKSANVMIDQDGHVRITDFGIARSLQSPGLTGPEVIIGTPEYMAPEQVEGKEADVQTDIYSLGLILYEMLTGKLPFQADTALGIALKQRIEIPLAPNRVNAQVPDDLSRVILKCLEKEKANRYQSAAGVFAELNRIDESILPTGEFRRSKTRKVFPAILARTRWIWAAIFVLVAVAIGVGLILRRSPPPLAANYENFIAFELVTPAGADIRRDLIEYLLLRSLAASTRWNVFVHEDVIIYKKKTESAEVKSRRPWLTIEAEVIPRAAGFEVQVSLKARDKTYKKAFNCKGYFDLIADQMVGIQSFISSYSDGSVGNIEGNRTPAQICSANLDAIDHYLKGEQAWQKLDTETAFFEYRTSLENDPEFSLANLKLAEVLMFRSDRETARKNIEAALAGKERLIRTDLLRLDALLARIDSRPNLERQAIGKLTEEFPFKKEYHYEFAESYFHCGDADEAIVHYQKALEIDPDYSLAHNHIAYCYSWNGDHKEAEHHFKIYVELDQTANSYDSLAAGYMFAGRYEDALSALRQATGLNPNLDYLYGNMARNLILKGEISRAAEAVQQQEATAKLTIAKMNAQFQAAFIEYLRGRKEACLKKLAPVHDFFNQDSFAGRLDESPNLSSWLAGVIAADNNNLNSLQAEITRLEQKIVRNKVSVTNYFPVLKFYVHLKALEGVLSHDLNIVLKNIDEAKRIWKKMGYWGSLFNMPYFFTGYAGMLLQINRDEDALALLRDADQYNPSSPGCHLGLAKIHLKVKDLDRAREEWQKAASLLKTADQDYILTGELKKIGQKLTEAGR